MRLIRFGNGEDGELAAALAAAGFAVDAQPPPAGTASERTATAALTEGLRAAEAACAGERPTAVVVADAGDAALAAALVAVKLEIPTAWLRPADAGAEDELVGRVADLTLDASHDADETARAVRDLAMPRLPGP